MGTSRSVALVARSALLLVALGCAPLSAQQGAPAIPVNGAERSVVTTSAIGESSVAPDRARIDLGVQTRAATAEQAATENASRVRAILDTLRGLGLAQDQISTVNYSVYPETRFEQGDREPRVIGYNVTNTVRAELRQLDQVAAAIDASLRAGANTIHSLAFYASNTDPARHEALQEGVRKARGDAEALASAAGGRLGRLIEVTTADFARPPQPLMRLQSGMDAAEAATPIEPGEQTIKVNVWASWEFIAGQQ